MIPFLTTSFFPSASLSFIHTYKQRESTGWSAQSAPATDQQSPVHTAPLFPLLFPHRSLSTHPSFRGVPLFLWSTAVLPVEIPLLQPASSALSAKPCSILSYGNRVAFRMPSSPYGMASSLSHHPPRRHLTKVGNGSKTVAWFSPTVN